jgi:hypothetical protein
MARGKTVSLRGKAAGLFVAMHSGKEATSEDEVLERLALAVHLDMVEGVVGHAVARLKLFKRTTVAESTNAGAAGCAICQAPVSVTSCMCAACNVAYGRQKEKDASISGLIQWVAERARKYHER